MWIKKIPFNEILKDGRWKVEFYCDPVGASMATKYPTALVSELVIERKESVEPSSNPEFLFNYVGLENVASLTGDLINFVPKKGFEIRSRSKVFHEGDVLYGRLRPYLNKIYLAEGKVCDGICSGEFYVLKPVLSRILPAYLRVVLASEFVLKSIQRFQTGAALPRLAKKDLFALALPVPPLDHQEELVAHLKTCNEQRIALIEEAERLPGQMMADLRATLQAGELRFEGDNSKK